MKPLLVLGYLQHEALVGTGLFTTWSPCWYWVIYNMKPCWYWVICRGDLHMKPLLVLGYLQRRSSHEALVGTRLFTTWSPCWYWVIYNMKPLLVLGYLQHEALLVLGYLQRRSSFLHVLQTHHGNAGITSYTKEQTEGYKAHYRLTSSASYLTR